MAIKKNEEKKEGKEGKGGGLVKTALWDSVCETNPINTKTVKMRGGFTSVNAQSQLYEATSKFGQYGAGWSLRNLQWEVISLAYGNTFRHSLILKCDFVVGTDVLFPMAGDIEFEPGNDCYKKLMTDVTTKALSKLGFNSDVFLGKYDDSTYVDEMYKKFGVERKAKKRAGGNPKKAQFCEEKFLSDLAGCNGSHQQVAKLIKDLGGFVKNGSVGAKVGSYMLIKCFVSCCDYRKAIDRIDLMHERKWISDGEHGKLIATVDAASTANGAEKTF